jgi:hypothetical protein
VHRPRRLRLVVSGPSFDSVQRGMSPPGVLATWIAPRLVVQVGQECPAVKRECPAPRRRAGPAVQPFVLDGLPGTPPAGHGRWQGGGRAFGACCFAGKLRSPAPPTGRRPHLAQLQGLGPDPYVNGYVNPYVIPYALGCVPWLREARLSVQFRGPEGQWSGHAARSASRDRCRPHPDTGLLTVGLTSSHSTARLMAPLAGVERPRLWADPAVRAACGGSLSLPWLSRGVGQLSSAVGLRTSEAD